MKKTLIKLTVVAAILAVVFAIAPQKEDVQVAATDLISTQSVIGDPGDGGRG